MQHTKILASLLAAGLITACGGGGGGNDPSPPPPSGPAAVTLTGVVAKGALRNATVRAHPVTDGSVDLGTVLGETTTDANGHYSLTFEASANQPYVIRVSATPETRQLDEITGQAEDVPDDFAMRALFVPAVGGAVTTSTSVTPFSEMAVAAAASGAGGVTTANASQAMANVTALLGFDPTQVTPTTIAGAGDNAQQLTYAAMLTAVSKLANDGGLDCAQATLADRTKCVVDTLAASASLASIKPGTLGGVDVAAQLTAAASAVVADNSLPPTVVAVVTDNLQGEGTPPPAGTSTDVLTAIGAAKSFFNNLRSDWTSLFGRSGGNASAVQVEADRFEAAMRDVQVPAELLIKDASALLTGIDLYRDYKAGRTSSPTRGRARAADYVANAEQSNVPNLTTVGCTVYQDAEATTVATSPDNAHYVGCQAVYYVTRQITGANSSNLTRWRHGFTLTPASLTSFAYQSRARETTESCTSGVCTPQSNNALQTNAYAGTVSVTADAQERVVGFQIQGELPGAFEDGGNTLVNERHEWTVRGTRTPGAVHGDSTSRITEASIGAYAAGASTPAGSLVITQATLTEAAVSRTSSGVIVPRNDPRAVEDAGGELVTGDLHLFWSAPGASFEGHLELTDNAWDASRTSHVPTRLVLSGAFRTLQGDVPVQFLYGSFTVSATGYSQYNATLPTTPTNDWTLGFHFSGEITAPNRPTVELTLATSMLSDADTPSMLTGQYRTRVDVNGTSTATQTVTLNANKPATGPAVLSVQLVGTGVSMEVVDQAPTATLRLGTESNGTEIGLLNRASSLITYVDGSTTSLDFGL